MFQVLLLQAMHGLSDERSEYSIKDRLLFMRFLGLGLADPVPDPVDCGQDWLYGAEAERVGEKGRA